MATAEKVEAKNLLAPGHTACMGCGQSLGARLVLNAAGPNTIVANATGCLEVFTTRDPQSSWEIPWIHSLFENAAAVASGIEAALKALGRKDEAKVIAQGGDGGTADIGMGALSGMLERKHDVLYVCYDNEAYMNTGIQRSSLTPLDSRTTTTPSGSASFGNITEKKDLPAIAVAHGVPYVATTSVAYPKDIEKKVRKALSITGPKYVQVHVPCPLGWYYDPAQTITVARLAQQTGLYPIYEMENGRLASVMKIGVAKPVEEYLKIQGRYRHLFQKEGGAEEIKRIQMIADENIRKFQLV
ncbi:MAG: thiamine pyrophosphate-dependent enzyme [Promethearchaeati archaeon SRVP18_Atabeyarchaeia-1]